MKRTCLAALFCCLLPVVASAAPCVTGSLASYIGLGATGCTIDGVNFINFVSLPLQGGATLIPDSSTLVNPLLTGNPGFRFDLNAVAGANVLLERVLGFNVVAPRVIGSQLAMMGSSATGDGAVTILEHECLGAAFGALQSCANPLEQSTFDLGALGQQLSDSTTFGGQTILGVVLDITVDGGPSGSANLTSATARFVAVPEPAALTLFAVGLAVTGVARARARRR